MLQVLYDLGIVSSKEPFQQLVSQGMILGDWEYTALQKSDGSFAEDDAADGTPVKSVPVVSPMPALATNMFEMMSFQEIFACVGSHWLT